jgi:hypothetical protein
MNGLDAADANKVMAFQNAALALAQQGAAVDSAVQNLAETTAAINKAIADAARAEAQASQDAALASLTTSNISVYRDYHSYDLYRAQALVDDARRYAVTARRAIEAKFLVDLSTMNNDEAFVAAPSSWADQIYDYDLSLPAAVGLSVGSATPSGIYPNKVLDYIGNLQRFVDGYAVNRPTASAHNDSDVLTVLGPKTTIPNTCGSAAASMQGSWSYYCPGTGWKASQNPDGSPAPPSQACGTTGALPTKARVVFSIDAWGRINAYGPEAPPTLQFNARWNRVAVNLVGTGIKDCSKALDPLACYSSSFVPYNLTDVGPSWVVDYDGEWRAESVPIGQINMAKALVAEQWLDPISNGWDKPYVQSVQRTEYAERPLDGTYQLELELGPEVQLDNLERIQILTDTSYWVKQQ